MNDGTLSAGFAWMLGIGFLVGPVLVHWIVRAPHWMHAQWGGPTPNSAPTGWGFYCLVTFVNAGLWGLCAWPGVGWAALCWSVFASVLWVLAWIDARSGWLPDEFTQSLLWLGLCVSALNGINTSLHDALWGAVLGYGILKFSAGLFVLATGREGLGGGDPKLLGAIGAWLGPADTLLVLLTAATVGAVTAGVLQARGSWAMGVAFPFGPFLVAAVALVQIIKPMGFVVFSVT